MMEKSLPEVVFPPSREAGVARSKAFLPLVPSYAARRNFDLAEHADVSRLSPYFTTRLVTEEEVVRDVLATHSYAAAEKFVQEICWRTYWKGWLEQRPSVWEAYVSDLSRLSAEWRENPALRAAEEGCTGLDCFDHWVHELRETGYLHNHARMWFASIWIFTLQLPWPLGAAFFHRHLLDGDPASNTLSWRWVAGGQTLGKHYLATAENIRKFTGGRFYPRGQLREDAEALPFPPHPAPRPFSGCSCAPPAEGEKLGLLLLGSDLAPEHSPVVSWCLAGVAGGWPGEIFAGWNPSAQVQSFYRAAFEDALARASDHFAAPARPLLETSWLSDVEAWARDGGFDRIITLYPPAGPWAELWKRVVAVLGPARCGVVIRPWDEHLWPHATRGFFPFKSKLPQELAHLQISPNS